MADTTPQGILAVIQSGWTQFMAIAGVIWWARKIDLRGQSNSDRLDRHEARLLVMERSIQDQAITLARIDESLSAIKITLDRLYSRVNDRP